MSQMPPPPPGQPAPMGGTPATGASNAKTNVILAYLLWWVTGIIFLFVGKDDPDVKWNAAQSVVVLGGLWLISTILYIIFLPLGAIVWIVGLVYWIIFLVGAFKYKGRPTGGPGIDPIPDPMTPQPGERPKESTPRPRPRPNAWARSL